MTMTMTIESLRALALAHNEICASAEGFRWLKCNLRYAAVEVPDGFQIANEGRWSELLSASGGKEV